MKDNISDFIILVIDEQIADQMNAKENKHSIAASKSPLEKT